MSIKRILIPTDFSETAELAVAHGAYMAQLFGAKIFLFHSVASMAYSLLPQESGLFIDSELAYEAMEQERLSRVTKEIEKKYNVQLSTINVNGRPAHGIADAVKENEIDMVIMGTHGTSGFEELFIGSNTYKVVNLVACPVISIQKFVKKVGFSNIIMPINEELHSRQKTNNVIELASAYKSTVHILGLLEADDELVDEQKFKIKLDSVEDKLVHEKIPYTKKLVRGHNLAIEALNYSEEVGGDLIVTMTGHEGNLTGSFLGAFAEQIVNHSKIPVMSIRPEETTIETFDLTGGTGVII
jgi:nucleotide-binding universal stress UspA family protein